MNVDMVLWQIGTIPVAQFGKLLNLSPGNWFAIAAIATLWLYVNLAPERKTAES